MVMRQPRDLIQKRLVDPYMAIISRLGFALFAFAKQMFADNTPRRCVRRIILGGDIKAS